MGFTPTTPQSAAGWRIDPPVSEPSPSGAYPAATAAAEPPLEPPGTRDGSCGLRVGPNAEFSVDEPIANSSRLVLATGTAPAASTRSTTVAVYGGRQPSRIRDEHVVGTPRVHRLSLSTIGTPASGPGSSPRATAASTASAAARADSAVTRLQACSSALARRDDGEVLLDDVAAPTRSRRGPPPRAPRARHGASRMRGTRNRPSSDAGAIASTSSRARLGPDLVGAEHVDERQRVRGGRHVVGVERGDLRRVLEDHPELTGEVLDLVVGQREARQLRDVLDVGARELGTWRRV